jgi:hypothetical protein
MSQNNISQALEDYLNPSRNNNLVSRRPYNTIPDFEFTYPGQNTVSNTVGTEYATIVSSKIIIDSRYSAEILVHNNIFTKGDIIAYSNNPSYCQLLVEDVEIGDESLLICSFMSDSINIRYLAPGVQLKKVLSTRSITLTDINGPAINWDRDAWTYNPSDRSVRVSGGSGLQSIFNQELVNEMSAYVNPTSSNT